MICFHPTLFLANFLFYFMIAFPFLTMWREHMQLLSIFEVFRFYLRCKLQTLHIFNSLPCAMSICVDYTIFFSCVYALFTMFEDNLKLMQPNSIFIESRCTTLTFVVQVNFVSNGVYYMVKLYKMRSCFSLSDVTYFKLTIEACCY